MSKTIWIINQYASLPSTGIGGRHRHLSRELTKIGHNVTLVAARWTHSTRDEYAADNAPDLEIFEGFRFLRISVGKYKHAHDKKRILNWFAFGWRIRNLDKNLGEHPDVIIYSSPSLIPFLSVYRLAKKFNARLIFEVRDIWPLTLIQLGGFSPKHPFIRFMQWIEDFAYRKSDHVISNLEGSVEHMKGRGLSEHKFTWIPNGYSEFELANGGQGDPKILEALRGQLFSITYTGAIGEANALKTLIDAAYLLKEKSGIHFNIFGQGRLEEGLKVTVNKLGLKNVHFWGRIPKKCVQSILQASDVCVICWRDSELYDYGIAANKLFDYLYSGRPVINTYSGRYDIVSRYHAGVTVPAESPELLSEAISELTSVDLERLTEMGDNGARMVSEKHEYSMIAATLNTLITPSESAH
jgi:glycosyltransferase involved in cell wall biosynthesis